MFMKLKKLFLLCIALIVSLTAGAQFREGASYEELYDSETVVTMKNHLGYLSAAHLEGRKAGSEGELLAAQYVKDAFKEYVLGLDAKKPVIICGDLNVAHQEIDLKNPKSNHHSAGFSDEERGKFTELLQSGFTDTFRALYPDKVQYSWWSYMMKAREKNVGWRIDYFVVSERLFPRVKDSFILGSVMGSDHCPVGIELEEGENR